MCEARLLSIQERRRLIGQLRRTPDARLYRRLLAILEYDQGEPISCIARRLNVSRKSIHEWLGRFREDRCATALCDAPRPGRPAMADGTFDVVLQSLLMVSPEWCGYRAKYWTVRLLRDQLRKDLEQDYSDDTIRRNLHRLGYVWKRPRYVLAQDPEQEKKTPNSSRPVWFAQGERRAG
jgi:transposase